MEAGLDSFMTYLTGAAQYYPSWDAMFRVIDREIVNLEKKRTDKVARERLGFISEVRLHATAVKEVWRNKTVHEIAKTYNERQAKVVFDSVRTFMEHLGDTLSEVPEVRDRPITV